MAAIALFMFIIGLSVPAIAGRFGKILPADPGVILLSLWHKPRFPKPDDVTRARILHKKWQKLLAYSLFWGIVLAVLSIMEQCFLPSALFPWACVLSIIIAFCIVIDVQYCLLPDFFTIPLLLLGMGMAVFTPAIGPEESFAGACFGYALATVSVLIFGLFRQVEFGAGDVKMMTAVGAWLGVFGLSFALLLSFFLFALQTLGLKNRVGPYGPALGIATLITFFMIYAQ